MLYISIAITFAFLLLPLVALFCQMTPSSLISRLHNSIVSQALVVTLETSLWALVVIVVVGTPVAHWLARHEFRGKKMIEVALMMPIVSPPAVAGVGLLLVFGRVGWLGRPLNSTGLNLAFSKLAVVLALVFVAGPFYIINARRAITDVDPGLAAVSRTLGLGPWLTFWRTELPLAFPGMLSGATLSLARALGEFGACLVFAGNLPGTTQTFSLGIYTVLQSDETVSIAMSAFLLVISFALLAIVSLADRRTKADGRR
jgi:molybdate transport system permease protein